MVGEGREQGGGGGTLHLTGKKKNRDGMVDGDDEDGEEKCGYAEERGGLEEEEEPLFRCLGGGRGRIAPQRHNSSTILTMGQNGTNLEARWRRTTTTRMCRRRRC